MVRELLSRVRAVATHRPAAALQLTGMAMIVAEALDPADHRPGTVLRARAQALREHGSVLAFMQRFAEALEHIDRAERLFRDVPVAEYDLARLALVKAIALQMDEQRRAVAIALARNASEVLLLFGDRPRYAIGRITEAAILWDQGALEPALAVWQSLEADPGVEDAIRVNVTHNVALCLCRLGRQVEAIGRLEHSLEQFERLGQSTERTRSRWSLGNALLATTRRREAIAALRLAWQEFAEQQLLVDAALAALDLAEALVVNEEMDQVPMICHQVIAQLTGAGLATRAIPALALLREHAERGRASRELIRTTYATVQRFGREGARLFAPPPCGGG